VRAAAQANHDRRLAVRHHAVEHLADPALRRRRVAHCRPSPPSTRALRIAVAADGQRRARDLQQVNEDFIAACFVTMSWMMPVCFWSPEW
jgi:hypothetical protein